MYVTHKDFKSLQKIVEQEIKHRENSYMEVSEVAWDAKRACKQAVDTSTRSEKLIRKVSILEAKQNQSYTNSNMATIQSTDRTQRRHS